MEIFVCISPKRRVLYINFMNIADIDAALNNFLELITILVFSDWLYLLQKFQVMISKFE